MEGEKNKGGWWKALGHIQSQYASFFLCSLQSNAIGTEKWIWKEWSPLFSDQLPRHCVLETGDLKTRCSSRHFAHDFFFRVRRALVRVLGSKPISGSALAVKEGIKNQLSTLRLFYFQCSSFEWPSSSIKILPEPEQRVKEKVNPFTEMIPEIEAVKLYSNILCLITMYIWCLNSVSFVTMKQPRCRYHHHPIFLFDFFSKDVLKRVW